METSKAVCLTTDGWTSTANESYISTTCHFITTENKMETCLLECFKYTKSHTADNLCEELVRTANDWKIRDKIVAIVSDNAANVVAAIKKTNWCHIPCFAHTLNLVVQYALEKIKPTRKKVKDIVEFFKRSPKATELLKETQKLMGKTELILKQDVITRWNSTFVMFQRILEIKDSLLSTIAVHYPNLETLTNEDFKILRKSCDLLEVFKDVSEEMCSEKQVTASKIILLSNALKLYCAGYLNENPDLPESVQELGRTLLESLNKRFQNIETNKVFAESTILDPRF